MSALPGLERAASLGLMCARVSHLMCSCGLLARP